MGRAEHQTPKYGDGAFGLPYHMEMLSDPERVRACKNAILQTVKPESVFCELGCGTGVFSIYAATLCSRVYAIELDQTILKVARRNAENHGVAGRIDFLPGNALEVELPERADVIFCEMMSTWLVNEPQVPVINRAMRDLLAEGGIIIPRRVINLVELGNVDYKFEGVELKASLPQFSGIRPPRIMTTSVVASELDLMVDNPLDVSISCHMRALVSGVVNCARLTSLVEFAPGVNFFCTDTLMPATVVPLVTELEVTSREEIRFCAKYKHRTNLDDSRFWCERFSEVTSDGTGRY